MIQYISYQESATRDIKKLFLGLSSRPEGLTLLEALDRSVKEGTKKRKLPPWIIMLIRQFQSAFIYLLFIAAGLSFWLGEPIDASLILLFVSINAGLGFFQEFRAEAALKGLERLLTRTVKVRRGGQEVTIGVEHLVLGDVVLLTAGDVIPADGRFIVSESAVVDESTLTGESVPVSKQVHPLLEVPQDYASALNMGFSRTLIVEGNAELLVTAAGSDTEVGHIAKALDRTRRESAFEISVRRLSMGILRMVLLMIPLLFALNFIAHKGNIDWGHFIIFMIALTISAIPEALPLVTTLALSQGAVKLAESHVVPRRLSAVEDLGSVDVLCTDKTGTITENNLVLRDLWGDEHIALRYLLLDPLTSKKGTHNVYDRALLKRVDKEKSANAMTIGLTRLAELPFDPDRRRESVLFHENGKRMLIIRGATEYVGGASEEALEWSRDLGKKGCRILAVSIKEVPLTTERVTPELEMGAKLVGIAAFVDPLKASTHQAVHDAEELGVQVKIVTGDSPEVAGWVAKEAGIVDDATRVLTGAQFMKMTEIAQRRAVEEYDVFARTAPLEKQAIISRLREVHTVAFLGEGFNDAPALKLAHVGIAVDGASDIARDAADIVLLNQSLSVIISGIKEGRKIFTNTVKYINATLTSNFGNFFALAASTLFVPYLPMLPIQILLLNLLSDFPMISIAGDRVEKDDTEHPRQYDVKGMMRSAIWLGLISTAIDLSFFFIFRGGGEESLRTIWFIGSILTELVLIYSIRSRRPLWQSGLPSPLITRLTFGVGLLTCVLPFIPLARSLFSFVIPSPAQYLGIFALVTGYILLNELAKIVLSAHHPKTT